MARSLNVHPYMPGTFGHYLQHERGLVRGPTDLPLAVRSVGRRLSARPKDIAPNSPMLPGLAKALGVPLDAIQAYAKAAPMTEQWLKKINSQLAAGTIPRGKKLGNAIRATHHKRHNAPSKPFGRQVSQDGKRGPSPRSAFGRYLLSAHNLSLQDLTTRLGINYALAAKITSGGLAPNHPLLPRIARELHVPLAKVVSFMKLPPMPDYTLKRIARQFGEPSSPRRRRHAIAKNTKHALTRLAAEKGLTLKALAKKLKVKPGVLWTYATGKGNPNHPLLPRVAEALGVPLDTLQQMAKGESRIAHEVQKASTAVVVAPTNGTSNGHAPRKYNSLRRQEVELRQAARSVLMTLNQAIMEGQEWSPPLSIAALHAVMQDYVNGRGGRGGTLVLDPRFSEFFDPK